MIRAAEVARLIQGQCAGSALLRGGRRLRESTGSPAERPFSSGGFDLRGRGWLAALPDAPGIRALQHGHLRRAADPARAALPGV